MGDSLLPGWRFFRVQAVEARAAVRDRLRHEGVDGKLGGIDRFTYVADVVDNFEKNG